MKRFAYSSDWIKMMWTLLISGFSSRETRTISELRILFPFLTFPFLMFFLAQGFLYLMTLIQCCLEYFCRLISHFLCYFLLFFAQDSLYLIHCCPFMPVNFSFLSFPPFIFSVLLVVDLRLLFSIDDALDVLESLRKSSELDGPDLPHLRILSVQDVLLSSLSGLVKPFLSSTLDCFWW